VEAEAANANPPWIARAARVAVQKSASFLAAKSEMRTSEPKPHEINKLLVYVRTRVCRILMRTSASGH